MSKTVKLDLCQCPKCGRMHKELGTPPKSISNWIHGDEGETIREDSDAVIRRLVAENVWLHRQKEHAIECEMRAADEVLSLQAKVERLRSALVEIASDPTGISTYQAELAKQVLGCNPGCRQGGRWDEHEARHRREV